MYEKHARAYDSSCLQKNDDRVMKKERLLDTILRGMSIFQFFSFIIIVAKHLNYRPII